MPATKTILLTNGLLIKNKNVNNTGKRACSGCVFDHMSYYKPMFPISKIRKAGDCGLLIERFSPNKNLHCKLNGIFVVIEETMEKGI